MFHFCGQFLVIVFVPHPTVGCIQYHQLAIDVFHLGPSQVGLQRYIYNFLPKQTLLLISHESSLTFPLSLYVLFVICVLLDFMVVHLCTYGTFDVEMIC